MSGPKLEAPSILLGLTGISLDGGISSVSRSIVRALDEEVEAGSIRAVHRVLYLDEEKDVEAPRCGASQAFSRGSQLRFAAQIWQAIIRFRPKFVLFDHVGLARCMFARWPVPRPSIVVFVHGLELRGAEHDSRRHALVGASLILSNSNFTAEGLSQLLPEVADRIQTVDLCIEPEKVDEWSRRQVAQSESEPRRPAAVIVGRMWQDQPGKGHDALISSWSQVVAAIPGAELWIVGTGDNESNLRSLATSCGVSENVLFKGRVSDDELSWIYSNSSVFAMPSSQEGFGLVYLEAMWHRLPCIVSNLDAGRFVVDEKCGLVVEYGNAEATAEAVISLLSNPGVVDQMGDAARDRVLGRFSYSAFSARLKKALSLGSAEAETTG